jgi:hypothetical protein
MATETPAQKIDRIDKNVAEIMTVLKGYNGYLGLCERHEQLSKDHYSLKRLVIGLIALLAGSGVISGGAWGLIKLLGG